MTASPRPHAKMPGGPATPDAKIIVLDVGHGNGAIVLEPGQVTLIDGGRPGVLLEALEYFGITRINTVILSHADDDHLAGIEPLLTRADIRVDTVVLNSAESRNTDSWMAFRRGLANASNSFGTRVQIGLAVGTQLPVAHSELGFHVVSPLPENALGGERGRDVRGRRQTANATSAVLRLTHEGVPIILFAGDIDRRGLDQLLESGQDIRARILVFPHHGGLPGTTDAKDFAVALTAAVSPQVVIFSVGRNRIGFPRPEIVLGVKEAAPKTHIVCTQLVRACAAVLPRGDDGHLSAVPATGKDVDSCCGGSLVISDFGALEGPQVARHLDFVQRRAESAMCLLRT